MTIVGSRIKERRIALNLSQEALADAVGTSQKQISRYESGTNDPTGNVIVAFAKALETSSDYLLGITDDPTPSSRRDELSPYEQKLLAVLRRGNKMEAARLILNG